MSTLSLTGYSLQGLHILAFLCNTSQHQGILGTSHLQEAAILSSSLDKRTIGLLRNLSKTGIEHGADNVAHIIRYQESHRLLQLSRNRIALHRENQHGILHFLILF